MSFQLVRCSPRQARTAVERWHYSHRMPAATKHCYGVYESERFVGAVVFGCGANYRLASPFGLQQSQVRELVRVALAGDRQTPTSQVVAAALRRLKADLPALRLVVSYADTAQGHRGVIYQAGNWRYLGVSLGRTIRVLGRDRHTRSLHQRYGTSRLAWLREHVDPSAVVVPERPKHKYAWPYDAQMRRRLRRQHRPYPRAVKESEAIRSVSHREGHVQSVLTAPNESQESVTIPQQIGGCRNGRSRG